MDTEGLRSALDNLSGDIDELEDSLAPMLDAALSSSATKLPLLDKAKLYVLATYAVESLLFSSLRISGVDAKAHPVFQELSRVKAYFSKITAAETAGTARKSTLDKDAAQRFIKHGLAGNEKYDRERMARERPAAKRKLGAAPTGTHIRFDGPAKRVNTPQEQHKNGPDAASGSKEQKGVSTGNKNGKRRKVQYSEADVTAQAPAYGDPADDEESEESSDEASVTLKTSSGVEAAQSRGHSENSKAAAKREKRAKKIALRQAMNEMQ